MYSRALDAGLQAIISPAVTTSSWEGLREIARRYPLVHPCYGLHPMFNAEHRDEDIQTLEHWIQHENPLAIGECGLDFFHGREDAERQNMIFEAQLSLATAYELPVVIHARRAVEDVLQHLRQYPSTRGVLHSYSGSQEQIRQLTKFDIYFGFGGPITWPASKKLARAVAAAPLDRILLETDAPDQAGELHRHARNEPAYLPEVAAKVAEIKQIPVTMVIEATTNNAGRLFGLNLTKNT